MMKLLLFAVVATALCAHASDVVTLTMDDFEEKVCFIDLKKYV
jgi:hypothetical protein